MAPASVSEEISHYPLSNLKVLNRAMQFPVVSDTVGEVSKYADTIRSNERVQSATHAVQAGLKSFTHLKAVAAMKDAVMNSTTLSDVVYPRMAGAVESLDSLACGGLDHLKAAVPAIAEPTPQLVETTKKAASGYWSSALEYLSSFTVAQISLELADKSLDAVSTMVGKAAPTVAGDSRTEDTTKTTFMDRLQERIGEVRQALQNLKKRGEPLASDLAAKVGDLSSAVLMRAGLVAASLLNTLHAPALLGYLGLSLQTQDEVVKEEKVETGSGSSEVITKQTVEAVPLLAHQQTAKRAAHTESSEED